MGDPFLRRLASTVYVCIKRLSSRRQIKKNFIHVQCIFFMLSYVGISRLLCTSAINVYHNQSCVFEPRSMRDVLDTTLCDKVVSDLRQVGGFLRVLWFPPPIKLTATIWLKYC